MCRSHRNDRKVTISQLSYSVILKFQILFLRELLISNSLQIIIFVIIFCSYISIDKHTNEIRTNERKEENIINVNFNIS